MQSNFQTWVANDKQKKRAPVPLFDVPTDYQNRTIIIANGPLDSNPTFVAIPCTQVSQYLVKHYGQKPFQWEEAIFGPSALKFKGDEPQSEKHFSNIFPHHKVALCYLGEKLGFGLFTLEDIPENTCFGIYAGVVKQSDEEHDREDMYQMQVSSHKDYFLQRARKRTELPYITGANKGNQNRFMQHLPTEKEVKEVFSGAENQSIVNSIARANIRYEHASHCGVPIIRFVTTREIKAKQQVGFSYGLEYFSAGKISPQYFDEYGHTLDFETLSFFNKQKFQTNIGSLDVILKNHGKDNTASFLLSILKLSYKEFLHGPEFDYKTFQLIADRINDVPLHQLNPNSALAFLCDLNQLKSKLEKDKNAFPDKLKWQIVKLVDETNKFTIGSMATTTDAKVLSYYIPRLKTLLNVDAEIVEEGHKRRIVIKDVEQLRHSLINNQLQALQIRQGF